MPSSGQVEGEIHRALTVARKRTARSFFRSRLLPKLARTECGRQREMMMV
jgi:hypothetical protein